MLKPFKAPTFLREAGTLDPSSTTVEPPRKRQRVDDSPATGFATNIKQAEIASIQGRAYRQPLKVSNNLQVHSPVQTNTGDATYYSVLWRKFTGKKNKTWDSDGILRVSGGFAQLQDISGKELGKIACSGPLLPGSSLKFGGRDVEVESVLSRADYLARRPHLNGNNLASSCENSDSPSSPGQVPIGGQIPQRQQNFIIPQGLKPLGNASQSWQKPRIQVTGDTAPCHDKTEVKSSLYPATALSVASRSKWRNPMKNDTVMARIDGGEPTPRHDPNAPNALVMKRPPDRDIPRGRKVVDVVVDPILSTKLREHQREGVKFLYECVMGFRYNAGQGAILADEMGLGKTLQTIALIWTLLKQNPIHESEPVIRKALIVCPASLIKNWRKEFRKWLGRERIGVFIAEDNKTRITDFTRGRSYSVMVIGYERLRSVYEELQKGHGIDLIIADEGHRLKTAQTKSAQAIQSLSTPRRVILSGTPIQNDLGEFFSMVDFVNPGALGTLKSFARNFEKPIENSRQPGATEKEVEKGEARSEELADTTNIFILRRTADVLSKYLPLKTEYVLMCRPTTAQATVYKHVLASPVFQTALGSSENVLQLITILKKVCNSPKLLAIDPTVDPEKATLAPAVAASIPPALLRNASASSKLRVLDQLLHNIRANTSEKVILVSNFTSTLDLLQNLLTSLSLPFLRLDGSTSSGKRQDLVDTFNSTDASSCFAFLLSAKAGGMGLNLVGASRLILFDVDWNPAIDAQAMARIHRDGQKRPCFIYRLLLAGALDEKIWQRQVTKLGLASSVLESKSGQASFSSDELKDLFRLDEGIRCQTHELIGCDCGGKRIPEVDEAAHAELLPEESLLKPDQWEKAMDSEGKEMIERPDDTDSDIEMMPNIKRRKVHSGAPPSFTPVSDEPEATFDKRLGLVKASEVDVDAQERQLWRMSAAARTGRQDQGGNMESLMAYSHIDTAAYAQNGDEGADMDILIKDDVLREVIKDEDNLINFVFAKTNS